MAWAGPVGVYRETGVFTAEVPDDHVAHTLIAVAQRHIAQLAMAGDVGHEVLESGLRGLMVMDPQKIS